MHIVYLAEFENVMTSAYKASQKVKLKEEAYNETS